MLSRYVLIAVVSVVLCLKSHGQFVVSVYDGFNYGTGGLAGQNGGIGWTTAWVKDYTPGVSFNVSSSGLAYAGLSTSGGSMVWASGGNGISEDSRSLLLKNSGVVYLQFLSQFGSTSGGGTPNVRLFHSGALTGGFGGNGGTYGGVMSILDATLNPASDGSSSSSALLSALNLVVARIDFGNVETKMWTNPNLSTFDYQNPPAPNATYSGLAPAFDQIAVYSRSPAQVDEITVLTAVPEPAAASLLTATLLLMGAGILMTVRGARLGKRKGLNQPVK